MAHADGEPHEAERKIILEKMKRLFQGIDLEKKYDEAIRYYSQAIDLDPENAVYYSNRSAAYLAEGDSKSKALKAAEKCLELKPEWAKAYSRKGAAEFALTRFDAARMTYVQG